MKFEGITKVGGGAYLSRYDLRYRTPSGGEKIYEMFSRDGGIDGEERLRSPRVDAVMIIMTDRAHERLLLVREFRLELDREIYGLPAGLIDPGETPEEAARRELKEETGLDLVSIRRVLPPAYSAVLHLHYYEGYAIKEIAALLRLPAATVGTRLARGRERLRRMLKEDD